MLIKIKPSRLTGEVSVPSSKSLAHRAIIWGATNGAIKLIKNVDFSDDVNATLHAMCELGAEFEISKRDIRIIKKAAFDRECTIDCNESGTTLRLIIPQALKNKYQVTITGATRLMQRGIENYLDIFPDNITQGEFSIQIKPLAEIADSYEISGGLSSQYASGMLLAFVDRVSITPPIVSQPYIDLTKQIMGHRGDTYICEGDYSAAAFWMVANAIGNDVAINNLQKNSLQGDGAIANIIKNNLSEIDIENVPDLAPILCVWAAFRTVPTTLVNTSRLKIKESDRGEAIAEELSKLGVKINNHSDSIEIFPSKVHGGEVNSHNDHRIAMSLAIAATKASGEVIIHGGECVKKSYPSFWEQYDLASNNSLEYGANDEH